MLRIVVLHYVCVAAVDLYEALRVLKLDLR